MAAGTETVFLRIWGSMHGEATKTYRSNHVDPVLNVSAHRHCPRPHVVRKPVRLQLLFLRRSIELHRRSAHYGGLSHHSRVGHRSKDIRQWAVPLEQGWSWAPLPRSLRCWRVNVLKFRPFIVAIFTRTLCSCITTSNRGELGSMQHCASVATQQKAAQGTQ